MSDDRWFHWGTLFFWAGAAVFGLLIVANHHFAAEAATAATWPVVEGEVVSAELEEELTSCKQQKHERCERYLAKVVYSYRVDGAGYEGRRVDLQGQSGAAEDARERLRKFAPGSHVAVHYNPRNPTDAFLVGEDAATMGSARPTLWAIAIALFLAGIAFNVGWCRYYR